MNYKNFQRRRQVFPGVESGDKNISKKSLLGQSVEGEWRRAVMSNRNVHIEIYNIRHIYLQSALKMLFRGL